MVCMLSVLLVLDYRNRGHSLCSGYRLHMGNATNIALSTPCPPIFGEFLVASGHDALRVWCGNNKRAPGFSPGGSVFVVETGES